METINDASDIYVKTNFIMVLTTPMYCPRLDDELLDSDIMNMMMVQQHNDENLRSKELKTQTMMQQLINIIT